MATTISRDNIIDLVRPLYPAVTHEAAQHLETWLTLLQQWNTQLDLTAAKTPEALADLALADAAVLASTMAPGASVVDVGAGAGAPGLALAMLRPDLHVTLVEPLRKRVSFLRTAIGTTGVKVDVVAKKGHELIGGAKRWDACISRATLEPAAWLELGLELCSASGSVFVLLARQDAPLNDRADLVNSIDYASGPSQAPRRICMYHCRAST